MATAERRSLFSGIKGDLWGASLEFIGTFCFLTLAYGGVQAATATDTPASGIVYILYASLCFGFSLLVSAWLFFRVTGGLFNPNVSLALLLVGMIEPVRFVFYSIAQLVGSIAAAAVVLALTPGPCSFNTSLGQGINRAQGVFIEMFITSFLVVAVLMLAAEQHQATPFAPVGVGLTLFVCQLWAIHFTGAAVNTARSFGPAVVTGFPHNNHWVYWLGPYLGSILGTIFYAILKHYHYWKFLEPIKSPGDPLVLARKRTVSFVGAVGVHKNTDDPSTIEHPSTSRVEKTESRTRDYGIARGDPSAYNQSPV